MAWHLASVPSNLYVYKASNNRLFDIEVEEYGTLANIPVPWAIHTVWRGCAVLLCVIIWKMNGLPESGSLT